MTTPACFLSVERIGPDFFAVWAPAGLGEAEQRMLVHREQMKAYFTYDRVLQGNMATHSMYHEPGPNTRTVIVGPAPTREEVLGTNMDTA